VLLHIKFANMLLVAMPSRDVHPIYAQIPPMLRHSNHSCTRRRLRARRPCAEPQATLPVDSGEACTNSHSHSCGGHGDPTTADQWNEAAKDVIGAGATSVGVAAVATATTWRSKVRVHRRRGDRPRAQRHAMSFGAAAGFTTTMLLATLPSDAKATL